VAVTGAAVSAGVCREPRHAWKGTHPKEATMTQELMNRANIINSTELQELLGPPPVLSSENIKAYDEILARLMQCFKPRDFMEQLLIKQLADNNWELMRYTRHKATSIERRVRLFREFQAKRARALAKMKEKPASKLAGSDREPATELGRMYALEDTVEGTIEDVDAILDRPTAEHDHARALEKSIAYHLQLDQLLNTAIARRNDTLEQLERYRRGSSKWLRTASDEIIDAEFNDVASQPQDGAPLVPSSGGSQ
jgi:hypothetical protein